MPNDDITNFRINVDTYFENKKKIHDDPLFHGLPLPTATLQRALLKLRIGEVTILGGYEGHGKSALAQQIAFNLAKLYATTNPEEPSLMQHSQVVLYVSLEMSLASIIDRAVTQETGFNYSSLVLPEDMSPEEFDLLETRKENVRHWPLDIIDKMNISSTQVIDYVYAELKRFKRVRLVVVDYLQLLKDKIAGTESERLETITQELKQLAMEQNLHVLALSSLNRNTDGGIPTTQNLRNSGGIGFAADNVILLHRPKIAIHDLDDTWDNVAVLGVNKARAGKPGQYHLRWTPSRLYFTDLTPHDERRLTPLPKTGNRF